MTVPTLAVWSVLSLVLFWAAHSAGERVAATSSLALALSISVFLLAYMRSAHARMQGDAEQVEPLLLGGGAGTWLAILGIALLLLAPYSRFGLALAVAATACACTVLSLE